MMSYEEDSDSSSDSGGHNKCRALPVMDIPADFDPTKPAASAQEYLQQVMYEAKQLKSVVTVELDSKRRKQQPTVIRPSMKAAAPTGYAPDGEMQDTILEQFFVTKRQVETLRDSGNKPQPALKFPSDNNPDHWCAFCFGPTFHRKVKQRKQQRARLPRNNRLPAAATAAGASANRTETSASAAGATASGETSTREATIDATEDRREDTAEGNPPLMSVLLNIKESTLQQLVEWQVEWLQLCGFSEPQGRWLYSLLSCLQKPLIPELCDNVRQVVLLCCHARATALVGAEDPLLPQLNLLITIVTRYFDQHDLADPR